MISIKGHENHSAQNSHHPMTQLTKVFAKHTLVMVMLRCHQLLKPTLGAYMLSVAFVELRLLAFFMGKLMLSDPFLLLGLQSSWWARKF
jgi:hypothetical protein